MTTQPTNNEQSIPRYFYDFTQSFHQYELQNAREHADLGSRLTNLESQVARNTRNITWWMIGIGAIGGTGTVSSLTQLVQGMNGG